MIEGKTIVSESVFVDLVKESLEPITEINFDTQIKNALTSISKFFNKNNDNDTTPEQNPYMLTVLSIATEIHHKTAEHNSPPSISFKLKININTDKDTNYLINQIRDNIKQKVENITGYKVDRVDININKIDY